MRPDCSWSMSTAGLTAQQICLPAESLYLSGSYCHRMAGSKPSSNYHHDPENLYFSMDPSHMEYSSRVQQQVPPPPSLSYERQKHSPGSMRLPPKKSRPALLSFTTTAEPSTPSPAEDDQVVPSFQRLSVYERSSPPQTPGRCAKPLPPLPGRSEPSPDQAMDNEVESFTSSDDSSCLVPDHCPKSSPFRYLTPSRRSFRNCGQINYAYFEGSTGHQKAQPQPDGVRELPEQQPPEPPEPPAPPTPVIQRHQERAQRKLRRSHSGPAGSFNKPTGLRVSCHQRYGQAMDKPEVPPRIPIPPRPAKSVDIRRWSAEVSSGAHSDEDRPPRVPPRDPLNPSSCRTPSPKSLPIYVNGVMPSTQSFAPDPKYVSTHRGLQRQNSEGSPCILPVVENGRKASATHYFLLPQRPAYLDKPCFDKFFRETDSTTARGGQPPNSTWDCQSRRKAHVDLV